MKQGEINKMLVDFPQQRWVGLKTYERDRDAYIRLIINICCDMHKEVLTNSLQTKV